jgi:stage II sporulation protein M
MDNKAQYLLLVFFLMVGIAAGTFSVHNLSGGSQKELSDYINLLFVTIKYNSIDYFSIFINSFLQNSAIFAIIALVSMTMMGVLLIPVMMIVKGFCVGFTVGVLSLNIGAGGFFAIIACTFLPNLVLLPCICRAAVIAFNHSITTIKCRRIPSTTQDKMIAARPHLVRILKAYLISLAGVALETLLTPALMMLI